MNTKAKVTCPFPGVPDGEFDTRTIEAGEIIHGDLAAVALREGWASPLEAHTRAPSASASEATDSDPKPDSDSETATDEKAQDESPENKAHTRAPRNKGR